MKDTGKIISQVLLFLAHTYDSDVCFYPADNQFYIIDRIDGELAHLSPISGLKNEHTSVHGISKLIISKKPVNRLDMPGSNPAYSLFFANSQPAFGRQEAVRKSLFLIENGEFIRFNSRRIEPVLSREIDDDGINELAFRFENLIISKLEKVKSPEAIRSAHSLYKEYQLIISGSDYPKRELLKLIQKLERSLDETRAKDREQARNRERSVIFGKIKTWTASAAMAAAIIAGGYFYFIDGKIQLPKYIDAYYPTPQESGNTVTLSAELIKSNIEKFNLTAENKIFPWRKNKIITEFTGKRMTEEEFCEILPELLTREF